MMEPKRIRPNATVAPQGRHSIAQGETLGIWKIRKRRSPERASFRLPTDRVSRNANDMRQAGECRPVGANDPDGETNPGFRCAPPWAIEYDPFGVGSRGHHIEKERADG